MIQKTFYTLSLEIITLLRRVSSTSYFSPVGGNRKPICQQSNQMKCTLLDQRGLPSLSVLASRASLAAGVCGVDPPISSQSATYLILCDTEFITAG